MTPHFWGGSLSSQPFSRVRSARAVSKWARTAGTLPSSSNVFAAAEAQGVDLVVIDTPARLETAALEAARFSALVVIPCRPLIFDIETVPTSKQIVTLAGGPPVVAVLNATPSRGRRAVQTRAALEEFGIVVCPHGLGQRAAVGDAVAMGLVAAEFMPASRAASEARVVADWIIREARCRKRRT